MDTLDIRLRFEELGRAIHTKWSFVAEDYPELEGVSEARWAQVALRHIQEHLAKNIGAISRTVGAIIPIGASLHGCMVPFRYLQPPALSELSDKVRNVFIGTLHLTKIVSVPMKEIVELAYEQYPLDTVIRPIQSIPVPGEKHYRYPTESIRPNTLNTGQLATQVASNASNILRDIAMLAAGVGVLAGICEAVEHREDKDNLDVRSIPEIVANLLVGGTLLMRDCGIPWQLIEWAIKDWGNAPKRV